MWWFNVHKVAGDQMERVINNHVQKGYELHYIRNLTSRDINSPSGLVQIVLKQDISPEEWEAKFAKRYGQIKNGEGSSQPPLPVKVLA